MILMNLGVVFMTSNLLYAKEEKELLKYHYKLLLAD